MSRIALPVLLLIPCAAAQMANSDPNYRGLRSAVPAQTFRVENIELKRDVGTLTLRTGQITFLSAAANKVVMAVFNGEGRFQLKPAMVIEERHLNVILGKPEVDEPIESALLCFTDGTLEEIRGQGRGTALDSHAADLLKDFRQKLRGVALTNVEADLLAEIYNPAQGPSFRAFLHGKQDADLRFSVVPGGVTPAESPEEVSLVNVDPAGERSGTWYLSHYEPEWKAGKAASVEDHRQAAPEHYQIETTIAGGGMIAGATTLRFTAKQDGARVLPLELLDRLRVTRVTGDGGRELAFIQEPPKEDPQFYVILPDPLKRGQSYQLRIEYSGGEVIRNEGGGNFSVGARESWYPNLNVFHDYATYDLTFKVPRQYTLVSVGKMVKQWQEGNLACSQWTSDVPLLIAGFNYGAFKKKSATDRETKYEIDTYAIQELPDYLHAAASRLNINLTPTALADRASADAQNSMRLFRFWFGDAPYGRLAITQQPSFTFGQSWPTLVYLPLFAFLDPTQRFQLMDQQAFKYADFIQEVTPHEISHQWWGHMVGFSTYHDQWLSEGFAEFSAGLFVEASQKPAEADRFWERLRAEITQKNRFGIAPNDAGPVWLGERLASSKTYDAYDHLIYPKGAYTLQMLRSLMRDEKTGDQDFIAMMHDYVKTYLFKDASTESFKSLVEKHMKPAMDAAGNGRMDWFFQDWIYGTDLPKYRLEYTLTPAADGKVTFEGKLTQSDVSPSFVMRVPMYFEIDGHWGSGGRATVHGNMTANVRVLLPKAPKRVSLDLNHDLLTSEIVVKKS